ncbi:MAG TPA: nucleotidyltransferase family protein [Hanamia sp.]|nr:nucleotidyltransferase family protein [Hanamia sp.]
MNNTGIIILAAGSSSRFGGIKQLLQFNKKTLIQNVIDEATNAELNPVIVVTGAYADEVSKKIDNKKITIVFNEHWETGMASGIVTGLQKALKVNNAIENIIIAICDQPYISSILFQKLSDKKRESKKSIVASSYAGTLGTPALFSKKYFNELLNLKGDEGAKSLIRKYNNETTSVLFKKGNIDVDTQKDYEELLKNLYR